MPLDIDKIYDKTCEAMKSHSEGLRSARSLSIVQGIALTVGSLYLLKDSQNIAAIGAAVFSILLTIILATLNYHHLRHTRWLSEYAAKLEEEYAKGSIGPCRIMREKRKANKHQKLLRFTLNSAIYIIVAIFAILVVFVAVFRIISKS